MSLDRSDKIIIELFIKKEVSRHCDALQNLFSLYCNITGSDVLFDSHLSQCLGVIERTFK